MTRVVRQTDLNGHASLRLAEDLGHLRVWTPWDVAARREWAGEPRLRFVHPAVRTSDGGAERSQP